MSKKKYIVIIPAYNEEGRIGKVVDHVRSIGLVDEVLVIDDGSDDRTVDVARSAGATVIPLIVHLGYGAALQTGYKYAFDNQYDVTIQMDGDGQHDPLYINVLVETIEKEQCDVAIGSRFLGHSKRYKASLIRRIGMRFFQYLIYLFIQKRITDPTSGYQALNKCVIEFFTKSRYYPPEYPDADIIILLSNVGFHIIEVPVIMHEDDSGKSMHSGLRPLLYMIKMLLSIFSVLFGQHRTFLRKNQQCL